MPEKWSEKKDVFLICGHPLGSPLPSGRTVG